MSLCFPVSATGLNYITYPVGPTSVPLLVTANAAANTKGTYAELIASLAFTCNYALIDVTGSNNGAFRMLMDIATGAGGAEVVKIPDLLIDSNLAASSSTHGSYALPWEVISTTRIAVRVQCSTGGIAVRVAVTFQIAGTCPAISSFINHGADTSDSGGVSIDPGGTINTKGAYSQITASSSVVAQSLMIMQTLAGNSAPVAAAWAIDFATGAGGAEVVLIPDFRFNSSAQSHSMPRSHTFVTFIAASTRFAIRASCNTNDATDRLIDAAVMIAAAPAESSGGGSFVF